MKESHGILTALVLSAGLMAGIPSLALADHDGPRLGINFSLGVPIYGPPVYYGYAPPPPVYVYAPPRRVYYQRGYDPYYRGYDEDRRDWHHRHHDDDD